jgi:hypothetical protein
MRDASGDWGLRGGIPLQRIVLLRSKTLRAGAGVEIDSVGATACGAERHVTARTLAHLRRITVSMSQTPPRHLNPFVLKSMTI